MNTQNKLSALFNLGQRLSQFVTHSLFGLVVTLSLSYTISAQSISTTSQLKQACENSPGNVVNITQPTKIEFGPALPAAENIATPCTIRIGQNASFEVKQNAVNFAGALVIQSLYQTKVVFEDAAWTASSVNINLTEPAYGSELISKQSRLQASAGNLSISLAAFSKFEMNNAFGLTNPNGLEATGMVSINANGRFSGGFGDASIQAGAGISINIGGVDSTLKLEEASLNTSAGAIMVSGGHRAKLEMSQGTYGAPAGISIVFASAEAGLKVKDGVFNGGSGSIILQAGGVSASEANIEINQSSFTTSSTVQITSGVRGKTIVDNVQLDGGQGVEVLSGNQGNSLVKNSRGTSATVRVAAGGGGVCLSDNNLFNAPVQNLCR